MAASQMRIARSAPLARHLRSDSSTSSVPTETSDHFHRLGGRLLDLDGLLQGEVVPFVQIANEKIRVDIAPVVADLEVLVECRDLLDGYQNLHAGTSSARRAGMASRISSMSSLTTNLPSLPVVLSASSNMVRSFGQLTT